AVVVLVHPVAALGDGVGARRAVLVGAVDQTVAVVVEAVGAGCDAELGPGRVAAVAVDAGPEAGAIGIGAVDPDVAVVVDPVVADLGGIGNDLHVQREGPLVGAE